MNALRNTVNLIGNLGQDPIITEFGNNKAVARFSIATNESYKDKNNEWVNNTTWHNVVAWGPLADRCRKLEKGAFVALQGKLTNDSYETKEGEKRQKTEIVLREFMFLDVKTGEATKK